MKTKYIILTIAILFSIGKTVNAQNDLQDMFAGFEATTREKYSNVSDDVKEGLRQYWLRQSDIRMTMESVKGGVAIINSGGKIGNNSDLNNGKIYAEFDWDNKALMMHLTADEAIVEESIFGVPFNFEKNQGTNHKQYTDKDGYWYVPYDDPNGVHDYIKFNAKQTAQGALEVGQDLLMEIWLNDTATQLLGLVELFTSDFWFYNLKEIVADPDTLTEKELEALGDAITYKKLEKIKEALKVLYDEKMAETVGFPVFIHWALMYSPNSIKAKFETDDDIITYNGISNCTKLTVLSGPDKNKSMIFDQYDRLIFINALQDGTAKYYYDKDVTVIIPAATTLGSMLGGIEVANKEKSAKESSEEAKKAIEEAKNEAEKEATRKKEIERLRNEELAKLEEQLKEAVTPQEREAIQQKIKELKELRENETNN